MTFAYTMGSTLVSFLALVCVGPPVFQLRRWSELGALGLSPVSAGGWAVVAGGGRAGGCWHGGGVRVAFHPPVGVLFGVAAPLLSALGSGGGSGRIG